ncbi:MAG: hypothetical protein H6581_08805 [Bacteroidia bacterium]|nr:hypothetical protein [Bacteroidia bacterium]
MKISFDSGPCQEPSVTAVRFGICDDKNQKPAFTSMVNSDLWIATIKNDFAKSIIFTPIDHCIRLQKEGTKDEESTCDGMLTFDDSIFLVELKDQGTGGWISEAKSQLENTLNLMLKSDFPLEKFRYKKAFACNRKHPQFQSIDNETNKRFFRKYGFRLDIQAEIQIK